jgi:hypothetical protein
VPDAQLIERVGVVDRDVGDHQIGDHQEPEHVLPDVPGAADLTGRTTTDVHSEIPQPAERGLDEFALDPVEVDPFLLTERPHDEGTHVRLSQSRVLPRSNIGNRGLKRSEAPHRAQAWARCQLALQFGLDPDPDGLDDGTGLQRASPRLPP